jgi:hypothetical protein
VANHQRLHKQERMQAADGLSFPPLQKERKKKKKKTKER